MMTWEEVKARLEKLAAKTTAVGDVQVQFLSDLHAVLQRVEELERERDQEHEQVRRLLDVGVVQMNAIETVEQRAEVAEAKLASALAREEMWQREVGSAQAEADRANAEVRRLEGLLAEVERAPWCHVYADRTVNESAGRGDTYEDLTAFRVQLTPELVRRIREREGR